MQTTSPRPNVRKTGRSIRPVERHERAMMAMPMDAPPEAPLRGPRLLLVLLVVLLGCLLAWALGVMLILEGVWR